MEYVVKVDSQGRLVIPARIRDALGLKGDGKAIIRLNGNRLIVEIVNEGLEERVRDWKGLALSTRAEPFIESVEGGWKWMSHEYAKRKLGLR